VQASDGLLKCSDEELLTRFRQGQPEVFAVLVRRYERELFGYLRRYLGDATLAEDVFQNTFLQVYTKIGSYDLGRPVRPWLYTIATHQAIDALRRNGRHQAVSLNRRRDQRVRGEPDEMAGALQSQGVTPAEAAHKEERRLAVRSAVERLPDYLRQVLVLSYFQGLKYREIAEVLEIPLGTVKSRLHAALQKLQAVWVESPAFQQELNH
jgi:RNA polymerase sigma-70 factor (ECF subfamily)